MFAVRLNVQTTGCCVSLLLAVEQRMLAKAVVADVFPGTRRLRAVGMLGIVLVVLAVSVVADVLAILRPGILVVWASPLLLLMLLVVRLPLLDDRVAAAIGSICTCC